MTRTRPHRAAALGLLLLLAAGCSGAGGAADHGPAGDASPPAADGVIAGEGAPGDTARAPAPDASAPGNDGALAADGKLPAQVPADRLDLSDWKLTLPVGSASEPTKPMEIKQPALATFSLPPYFQLTPAGDGVVFQAHCGGVTTSGSSYPRSELREMTQGGSSLASWSTTSGTHTLFIKQAVTHLPVAKPHVVAGQIHGSSDDVIVVRLEGAKLFIDLNGNDGPVLDPSYTLGTVFTVKFVASGGKIKIFYNGSQTPAIDYDKSASGCYFKAGCYTQSNTDKGDAPSAYGEVIVYDLWVSHS